MAHYDDFERYGTIDKDGSFIGYNGDIGTWVQQAFNFSYDLHPMLNKDSFVISDTDIWTKIIHC